MKTFSYLAYKTYKAFMAFKHSRPNPFHKYRSITFFAANNTTCVCVCKYFECLHHKAPGNRKPKPLNLHPQDNPRTNTKWLTKELIKYVVFVM